MKRCLFVFCCLMSLSSALFAAAERRVALVIGNNDYQNLPKLEKAVNDANSVAGELKKVGFEVAAFNNISQKKMNQAINDFVQKIAGGGVGVFFYAGHGVQIDSQNFLVPVDMDSPRTDSDVADQAISVPRLQDKVADAKAKYVLMVLDACRDNPLPKKAGRSIGATRGLAMSNSPSGQTVLYSAGTNQQALDSLDKNDTNPNGLFTREFLPMISQPGVSSTDALRKTRSIVKQKAKTVGHDQDPAIYDQSDGDFYFVPGKPQQVAAPGAASGAPTVVQTVDPKAVELSFWDSIKNSKQAEDYQDYLSKYPNGQFAALATRRVSQLGTTVSRSSSDPASAPSAVATAPAQVAMASPPPPPPPPPPPSSPASSGGSIASKLELLGWIDNLKVTDLRAAKKDNLWRIQVEVTNFSSSSQQINYRFKWLDANGFMVWDDEPWKPLTIYGNQKQMINVSSPTFKATDVRIMLQSMGNAAN